MKTWVAGEQLLATDLNSTVPPCGSILPYAGSSAPTGWLICDGSAISRTTYSDLFTVCSTTYGVGDGSSTFNIPNLKGKIPVGLNSSETEFDVLGETGGEKTHQLTIAEMPAHTHPGTYRGTGSGGAEEMPGCGSYSDVTSHVVSQGGDGAHNNLQPYITLNYIIKI